MSAMQESQQIDKLLSDRHAMDDFIHRLAHLGITNCDGQAYRQVRLCYYEDGILLRSYHHVHDDCDIAIATDPTARVIPGSQTTTWYGDPDPKPSSGEFVVVWSNGRWVKEGPWQEPIRNLLERLILRLSEKKAELATREEARRAKLQEEEDRRYALLEQAWSGKRA